MHNKASPYVEMKQVTWSKDSHGLFDYESRNINSIKSKVDSAARVYKDGANLSICCATKVRSLTDDLLNKDSQQLFSITTQGEKNDQFFIQTDRKKVYDDNEKLFLIVRSLKNEDNNQKGYNLEIGDILRLGRIEYKVIEFKGNDKKVESLLTGTVSSDNCPFSLNVKDCNVKTEVKKQCRICLMDESDTPEVLVNPCNCKGTSEFVHVQCLQDWINSKLKKKLNAKTACSYWKKLFCEVCKVVLPDLVEVNGTKQELIPIQRPDEPYILLERVFYDKSKESFENSKMLILLSISGESQTIKMGRGHECDLRENDISVSRLHAYIQFNNGKFTIFDNNSKFGTLVLFRKNIQIEMKKKLALQLGRTVITFSLKQPSVNNVPVFRHPMLMEKLTKSQSPKTSLDIQVKPNITEFTQNTLISPRDDLPCTEANLNGSFLE